MKERPILFKAEMVRALLDGRKTQTRRVVKLNESGRAARSGRNWHLGDPDVVLACPYGQPSDRLWVRETWKYWGWTDDGMPWIKYAADGETKFFDSSVPEDWCDRVEQIWEELSADDNYKIDQSARDHKWRPSIFMPRWASRINLEIENVRVERLQDISEDDAKAEGAAWGACGSPQEGSHKAGYAQLWENINGPGSWDANPWVWVVEFKRVKWK